jgi:hypothetical protein
MDSFVLASFDRVERLSVFLLIVLGLCLGGASLIPIPFSHRHIERMPCVCAVIETAPPLSIFQSPQCVAPASESKLFEINEWGIELRKTDQIFEISQSSCKPFLVALGLYSFITIITVCFLFLRRTLK